jgi:serine/threonine-protein kinase
VPYAPPPAYYDYEEPRRRAVWPWLLALLFVAGAIVGGYFLYHQIQHQLNSSTVHVENYLGIREIDADQKIRSIGLVPNVVRQPSATVAKTFVFHQDPQPGTKLNKGNQVTIIVSSGPPQVTVPNVIGTTSTDAVAELANAHLKNKIVQVNSNKPSGQVIDQSPQGGASVNQDSTVTLKVSKGPQPIAVPSVVGQTVQSASSALQGAGFAVATKSVASNQPKDIVVDQSPAANTSQPPGTTITLSVSKGPKTSTVPDVTSQDQNTAQSELQASGFKVRVESQPTNDPNQDGIVLTQNPQGGTQAPQGTTVTIVVGKLGG